MAPKKRPPPKEDENDKDVLERSTTTPKKVDQRADGHLCTPKKSKVNLEFWGKKTKCDDDSEASSSGTTPKDSISHDSVACVQIENLVDLAAGTFVDEAVQVRVTFKSPKRSVTPGVMFDFHAMDNSGEVGFVCFPKVVDLFFDQIQNYIVEKENERYPTGAGLGNLKIILRPTTSISPLEDLDLIPPIPFNFLNLDVLDTFSVGHKIDLCGILVDVCDIEKVKSSVTGLDLVKREIGITDKTKSVVVLTTWGSTAEQFNAKLFSTIVLRKASLSEFQGRKSLTAYSNTLIWIKPDLQEAQEIRDWFKKQDYPNQL